MSDPTTERTRSVLQAHWRSANARDWPTFGRLLAPGLQYRVPQTREAIDGAAGYLDMFATWPGAWQAEVVDLVCDGSKAWCRLTFVTGDSRETGLGLYLLDELGRIADVTDYWPAPYDPPPRVSRHLVRQPA